MSLNKKLLSERDICTKYITPALEQAGWNRHMQFLEEVSFTDGKIYVRGKLAARGQGKRADYILYYKPNIPHRHHRGEGQQPLRAGGHPAGAGICEDTGHPLRVQQQWGWVFVA